MVSFELTASAWHGRPLASVPHSWATGTTAACGGSHLHASIPLVRHRPKSGTLCALVTHTLHSNIALDLTLAIAAQPVLRPRCLLTASAAQRNVGQARKIPWQ